MAKVVPAINVHRIDEYREAIKLVRQLSDRFQLDVIDSEFAGNATVNLDEVEIPQGIHCDMHIMSPRPEQYLPMIARLRPHLVVIQFEGVEGLESTVNELVDRGVHVGLAINPRTRVDEITEFLPRLAHVLVMAYPAGFSGQKLQPAVLKKVAELRELQPQLELGLDGGVAGDTLAAIAQAKLDVVNVTTYLFSAKDPLDRYSELMDALG